MDSQRAIIGCDDTRALIFDMHSGRLIRSLPPNPGPVTALHVSKMDDFLITAGERFSDERLLGHKSYISFFYIFNFVQFVIDVLAGGNKITFYSFRNEEPRPHLKRNPKGKPLRQLSLSQRALINATNAQPATCFDISRDSQLAAVAAGRTVQIWTINTPQLRQTLENHTALVTCVRFSPNCEFIASGGEDKIVVVWNLVFGLIVTTFKVCHMTMARTEVRVN